MCFYLDLLLLLAYTYLYMYCLSRCLSSFPKINFVFCFCLLLYRELITLNDSALVQRNSGEHPLLAYAIHEFHQHHLTQQQHTIAKTFTLLKWLQGKRVSMTLKWNLWVSAIRPVELQRCLFCCYCKWFPFDLL